MADFKKDYTKLYKNYGARLKAIHKKSFSSGQTPLDYFVTYLQFLRDKCLLVSPLTETLGLDNINLTSLVAALSEYQQYEECIEKYYIIDNGVAVRRPDFSEEEANYKFQEERLQHWEAFWELVKVCIEGWNTHD